MSKLFKFLADGLLIAGLFTNSPLKAMANPCNTCSPCHCVQCHCGK